MNELVSIVVPMYNAEKTIKLCLDSLINQTYNNIEIIVVDDGSKDNGKVIVESYEDSRINFISIENHGVSYARNIGIKSSSGQYVVFCDSDDYVELTYIENLLTGIKETGSDLSICNYTYIKNGVSEPKMLNLQGCFQIKEMPTVNWCELFGTYTINGPVCKIYKKEIINKLNLEFSDEMNFGEDLLFNLRYLFACNSINISNLSEYYYVIQENSITRKFSEKKVKSLEIIYNEYKKFISTYCNEDQVWKIFYNSLIKDFITFTKQLIICNNIDDKEKKELFKSLKTILKSLCTNTDIKNSSIDSIKKIVLSYLNYYFIWKLIF